MSSNVEPIGPQARFSYYTLGNLRERNVAWIEFWCVRNSRRCSHRKSYRIDDAIKRFGETTMLIMLARRTRCSLCGATGCHVQPGDPAAFGMPEYREQQLKGGVRWP